jgi:hypothetical protein
MSTVFEDRKDMSLCGAAEAKAEEADRYEGCGAGEGGEGHALLVE